MDFQKIIEVREPEFYLDTAIRKSKLKGEQISVFCDYIKNTFDKIVISFPSFDNLSEFHKELVANFLDYDLTKKHLGTLKWAGQRIKSLESQYKKTFKEDKREFFGRASSIMRQVRPSLEYWETARKKLREFPNIKDYYTVCVVGFPNVGKTTLLTKITSSKPEINSYAFTTKVINIGYIKQGLQTIQVLDTPGTLNRLDKMNQIEKQAYLALKYTANLIVYVFDLTEPYDLEEQFKLFEKLRELDTEMIVYLSKKDLLGKKLDEFKLDNTKIFQSPKELVEYILVKSKN